MKRIIAFITRTLQFVYKPEALGISYRGRQKAIGTKAILESLGALLALVAAYSDLSQRFIELVPVSISSYSLTIGRLIAGILGVLVCGHILVSQDPSTPGGPKVFSYGRLPRWIASVFVLFVLVGLGVATYDLFHTRTPYGDSYFGSRELPSSAWQLQQDPNASASDARTYMAKIVLAEKKVEYKHLLISVVPIEEYKLLNVSPHTSKTIPTSQEPLDFIGSNTNTSKWLFPEFDESLEWRLSVTVTTTSNKVFSDKFPFQATVYFSK